MPNLSPIPGYYFAYEPPVANSTFSTLAFIAITAGLLLMSWFFTIQVTAKKTSKRLTKELLISLIASTLLGFGVLFLLLAVGVNV